MESGYIERRLNLGDKIISEADCLTGGGVIVVLAEPGAGKTKLLKSLANRLGVRSNRASIFRHSTVSGPINAIAIDALDEVARQDQSAVDAIIVKAHETGAATAIFASRSSEWADTRNRFIEDCFGKTPKVVRLHPFREDEQRTIFEKYFPGEDFSAFLAEATRFELEPLLGNPMFLRLIAEAYVQGNRRFQSKRQIFKDAIDRLASDANISGSVKRPPVDTIVTAASEIFAKLLLSGAVGVSTIEQLGDQDFPYLSSLSKHEFLANTLDTRLFRPADSTNHEPVHRIVAEYCAARYLTQRIDDLSNRFSARRCLAIIAPNNVVRDELRGLLGWLATLGSKTIQEAAIELDPYAVLANGDPSQLAQPSKLLLLRRLRQLSEIDPYFRRSDVWRRFNLAGFFTADILNELKAILTNAADGSHLLNLVLELLQGSETTSQLTDELRALVFDPQNDFARRDLAYRCLAANPAYDSADDLRALVNEGGLDSLSIVAEAATEHRGNAFDRGILLALFRRLAEPTSSSQAWRQRSDYRYYISQLVDSLNASDTGWLLDELTRDLRCTCGAETRHRCRCRGAISKIVGHLLDRYFEVFEGDHDPAKIWQWTRNLRLDHGTPTSNGSATKALQSSAQLRQSIHLLAFDGQTTPDQITETTLHFAWSTSHPGLVFQAEDTRVIADHAFATGNVALWISVAHRHNWSAKVKGRDEFRAYMRAQARENPKFMREWAKRSRDWRKLDQDHQPWSRRSKRRQRRSEAIKESNFVHLRTNREEIERGKYWEWNYQFAHYYLHQPEKMSEIVDDVRTAERALANCIPELMPHLPNLGELATRKKEAIAMVLHAACLVHFRSTGNLSGIDRNVLAAVKTDAGGARGYNEGEGEKFEAELDTRLFATMADVETFAREFIEPTILNPQNTPTNVGWLEYKKAFQPLQGKLAAEWLERFPNASEETTGKLFDICARHCDRSQLVSLIERRCKELKATPFTSIDEIEKARRKFWFLRHFFFCEIDDLAIWTDLLSDRDAVFALEYRAGRLFRDEARAWPALSADKVYRILDAYVEVWPKVFLPNSWGTGSPREETAYRFLTDVFWQINRDDPDRSIAVLDKILADSRFTDFQAGSRSMKAAAIRRRNLQHFIMPKPADVAGLLDVGAIASVEDMRALLIEELEAMQTWLNGAETDPLENFYAGSKRVDENTARNRIVERLQNRMAALNMLVVIEHHMADSNRCDFTISAPIEGRRLLLVTEVKGQWHQELFSAAATQLNERYAIHPDAAHEGVYLALWFGSDEKVAGKKSDTISTATELRTAIVDAMPPELRGLIDVFVLDLSRQPKKSL